MILRRIIFFESPIVLICDADCKNAWGNQWTGEKIKDKAPDNPGTYEGGHGKPLSKNERLNKWCARECERSQIVEDNVDFELEERP